MIPLGILAAAGGAVAAAGSYDLLATEILTSSQASVTFASLGDYAADYQHLQIRFTGRSTRADTDSVLGITFNSGNYSYHQLHGNGSTVASGGGGGLSNIYGYAMLAGGTLSAGVYSAGEIDILDPFLAAKNTTIRSLHGIAHSSYPRIVLLSGASFNTSAITNITFSDLFGQLATGTRFSLYGLKAGA